MNIAEYLKKKKASKPPIAFGQSEASKFEAMNHVCPKLPEPEFSEDSQTIDLCMGCFWGPDQTFSETPGVTDVTVGYCGGKSEWPTYKKIGDHTEGVRVVFDPSEISFRDILRKFFESHSPTEPSWRRQYRSAILYHTPEQKVVIDELMEEYRVKLKHSTKLPVDVEPATPFYRGEEYHQKFYAKQNKKGTRS